MSRKLEVTRNLIIDTLPLVMEVLTEELPFPPDVSRLADEERNTIQGVVEAITQWPELFASRPWWMQLWTVKAADWLNDTSVTWLE